jgi:hypothetical protein
VDDPCEDFGEEEPLASVDPYFEGARPAKVCECPSPRADADSFEDLPGKWQAAIVSAEQNRPKLHGAENG